MTNECLTPEQWGILADPDVADESAEPLLAHAVACAECARGLDLLEALPRVLPIEARPQPGRLRPLHGLAAAALLLLAGLAAWLLVPTEVTLEGTWTDPLPVGRPLRVGAAGATLAGPDGVRIFFAADSELRSSGNLEHTIERGEAECLLPASAGPLSLRVPGGRISADDAHFKVIAMKYPGQTLFVTILIGSASFAAESGRRADLSQGDSLRISTEGEWTLVQDQPKPPSPESVERLLARLESGDPDERAGARRALRERGPEVLPDLQAALQASRETSVRDQLKWLIQKIEEEREADFGRLMVKIATVRRRIAEAERATGVEDVYAVDGKLRYGDIPSPPKLGEILGLKGQAVERLGKAFEEFEAARREARSRIDGVFKRQQEVGDDPFRWKEFIAAEYPVLSREVARESGLADELIEAIKEQLDEGTRESFERLLKDVLAEKIYRQILPDIRFYYAGDPPAHEGLGAGRLLGRGKAILPGLKRAREDERFPLEDRRRLDPIIRELERK
jgi:hypothetical protein